MQDKWKTLEMNQNKIINKYAFQEKKKYKKLEKSKK